MDYVVVIRIFFFFKQQTAYEMRISDWSSDVCSSDLLGRGRLLVEDVEHVEEELDLADRERLGVLQAHVQGVVRRSSFAANGTLLDPAVEHAAVLEIGRAHV